MKNQKIDLGVVVLAALIGGFKVLLRTSIEHGG
jgi:hypothetical protein